MASKIKIKVFESESNKKINLPAIPFWLLSIMTSIGLGTKRFWLNAENISKEQVDFFENLDNKEVKKFIKEIRKELKSHKKFDLVDIKTGSGTSIKISIL